MAAVRRHRQELPHFEHPEPLEEAPVSDPTLEYALILNASMDYADGIALLLRKEDPNLMLRTRRTGRHLPTDLPFAEGTDWIGAARALASAIDKELDSDGAGNVAIVDPPIRVTISDVLASLTERVAMLEVESFEDVITSVDRVTKDGDSPEMVEVLTVRWKRPA